MDGDTLLLSQLPPRGSLERRETMRMPLGIGGLSLETSIRSAPITSPLIIAMLLPILMWAAAAGIGWFVVDRLLIRPLKRLERSRVADHSLERRAFNMVAKQSLRGRIGGDETRIGGAHDRFGKFDAGIGVVNGQMDFGTVLIFVGAVDRRQGC